jgi:hypothetical protein
MSVDRFRFVGPCLPIGYTGETLPGKKIVGYTRQGSCFTAYGHPGWRPIYEDGGDHTVPLDDIEDPTKCCINLGISDEERKQCDQRGLEQGSIRCEEYMRTRCGYPNYKNDSLCDQYRTDSNSNNSLYYHGYTNPYAYGHISPNYYGYTPPHPWGQTAYPPHRQNRYTNPWYYPSSYHPVDYYYYKHGDDLCDEQPEICNFYGIT